MKVILSGGGTGGHIYPALTIARELQRTVPNCDILFIGTKQGLESDIIPKEGFPLQTISVQGFRRRITVDNLRTIWRLGQSILCCRTLIRRFRPDVVVGTGGYVCGPVVFTAALLGVPTVIQEQNAIPGVTNKIAARFVKLIAAGYEEAVSHFSCPQKVVVTGNPIRPEIIAAGAAEGRCQLGLADTKLTLLVVGGSRGARSINQAMIDVHRHFAGDARVQIVHVTGQNEYQSVLDNLQHSGINLERYGNIMIKPYLYDLPTALATADLAVYRAGAIGLAELTARGIPSILIPYPYAAENHQEYNARVLEQHGAATVILDKDLTGDRLVSTIDGLITNPQQLQTMAAASRKMGRPQATRDIVQHILTCLPAR